MSYEVQDVPLELTQLPLYLQEELQKIALALITDTNYNEAQLKDKSSTINTRLKGEGVRVWDSTLKKPIWATGKAPTATWVDGAGTIVYSPV